MFCVGKVGDEGMAKQKNKRLIAENDPVTPKKKRKLRWWGILLIVLACLWLAIAIALQCAWWWLHRTIGENVQPADSYTEEEVDANDKDDIVNDVVEANPDVKPEDVEVRVANVKNIALFGVDQDSGSVGRSDAMIILSIDRANNKIKMISLSRDSLVPIEGHGEEKLTHAWAYGQAKLAIKTINQSFGMNITDYVYVNFEEMVEVIDFIGGVYLDVDAAEMELINYNHAVIQQFYDETVYPLPAPGYQLLNGAQALQYARDRTNGGDTTRTARQREVLTAMYQRVKEQPLSKLPGTLSRVLRLCHTNLDGEEIADIATWALTSNPTITSLHMPTEDMECWNGIIDRERGWVRIYDLDQAKTILHDFIYEPDTTIATDMSAADTTDTITDIE